MKIYLYILLILTILPFLSCKNSKKEAKGNKVYGGIVRYSENELIETLYPISIQDIISARASYNIYDGLVRYNTKKQKLEGCLAEKWEISPDAKTFTFFLKKGVLFHDDPCFENGKGREVKAQDIKYSFQLLCTPNPNNFSFESTFSGKVIGADDFFIALKQQKQPTDISGVKIIDDYTIQISLKNPCLTFLNILSLPACFIVPREGVEKYGKNLCIGTGPFKLAQKSNDKYLLVKNENYHRFDSLGNQLPFIDSLEILFIPTKSNELDAFMNDKIDVIAGLPSESVNDVLEEQIALFAGKPIKYILARSPELATQYLDLCQIDPFKDIKVRKAFAYAIDREKIVVDILKDQSYGPGIYGLTPPVIKDYDVTKITGYNYNPELAKKLLAEAGFPDGKNFPQVKMEFNSGGAKNSSVAFELQNQWLKTLNINIGLEIVPLAKKIEDSEFGRAGIFKSAWIADYSSPESFLSLGYGKSVPSSFAIPSYPNVSRYSNASFDSLFEKGSYSTSLAESYEYFLKAEQKLMDDCPIIVINYEEDYKMFNARMNDFNFNPVRIFDFSETYIKPLENEEKKEDSKSEN